MDVVTKALVSEFATNHGLAVERIDVQFEYFANFIVLSSLTISDFDGEQIRTEEGEVGIDGLAIIVNDHVVYDQEQLADIVDSNTVLSVKFVFVQAKTSSSFDLGDFSVFLDAVDDFMVGGHNLPLNESHWLRRAFKMKARLYDAAAKFTRGLPEVSAYYVTSGEWTAPKPHVRKIAAFAASLRTRNLVSNSQVHAIGRAEILPLYTRTKNAIETEVDIPLVVSMPNISGIKEGFIGLIALSELSKLVLDENGEIMKKVFFDNIRDFQGETSVNAAIADTLSSDRAEQFVLRNNGITLIARELDRVSTKFIFRDYQIVNGCQTSHIVGNSASEKQLANTLCPIKIVHSADEDTIKQIIIGSNSQNKVDEQSFWTLDEIHKKIEILFESKSGDSKLYYERRPGQFAVRGDVEGTRIVNRDSLLKSYASMYHSEMHRVGRYYKDLLPQIGQTLFAPKDELGPYYTSAYSSWRMDFLFRSGRLERSLKPFRYPLLYAVRRVIEQDAGLIEKDRFKQKSCNAVDRVMEEQNEAAVAFERANDLICESLNDIGEKYERRAAKTRDFRDALIVNLDRRPIKAKNERRT